MPWTKTTPMTEHLNFLELYQTRLWSMTELCTRFCIRRKTGDPWLRRYAQEGFSGRQEQSRTPLSCPHRIAPEVAAVLLEAKHLHPPTPAWARLLHGREGARPDHQHRGFPLESAHGGDPPVRSSRPGRAAPRWRVGVGAGRLEAPASGGNRCPASSLPACSQALIW